jgi:hypothetical protein
MHLRHSRMDDTASLISRQAVTTLPMNANRNVCVGGVGTVIYDFSAYQRCVPVHSDVDRLVGGALRAERLSQELSETSFAVLAAVSVDQLRRYERGVDRISAARLFEFAKALRVPVKRFFEPFG